MLESNCVPSCFNTGVIIPIMKKATLDPNIPEHYRPITLSSTYSKLFESIIIPDVTLNNNQFGFRKGCGTSFGIGLLNDLLCHYKQSKSPMFICSLDAECFLILYGTMVCSTNYNVFSLMYYGVFCTNDIVT